MRAEKAAYLIQDSDVPGQVLQFFSEEGLRLIDQHQDSGPQHFSNPAACAAGSCIECRQREDAVHSFLLPQQLQSA